VEGAVVVDQHRRFGLGDGLGGFFKGFNWDMWIDLLQGSKQATDQDHLLVVAALRCVAVVGNVRAKGVVIATDTEPVQTDLFKLVFGDFRHETIPLISSSRAFNLSRMLSIDGYSPNIMFAMAR